MVSRLRPGLSRERVLQAALDIVDREGVEALTMRGLGRELGVEAMSLYGYVSSKQDLIEGVVEQIFREMPLVTPGPEPWRERLRMHAAIYRQTLLRHPNAVRLVAGRPLITEGTVAFVESALVELRSLGLDLTTADRVLGVIASFTIGHVAEQVGRESRRRSATAGGDHQVVDAARFPNVAAIEASPIADPDTTFYLGFDFILSGIEQLLQQ